MAEISVLDLPLMAYANLTENDRLLIIDDGTLKQFTWANMLAFIQANVQGEKGDQGVKGTDGRDGTNGTNGRDGENGLSAYQVAVNNGFVGTVQQWLDSLKGSNGQAGTNGTNGWTPILAVVPDGDRRVIAVTSWTGGSGTAPSTGYYGSSGIVQNISSAVDIRGIQGLQGLKGDDGIKGDKGDTGEQGDRGFSAYEEAVSQGFVGTIEDWLLSLKGPKGDTGEQGLTVTDVTVASTGKIILTLSDDSVIESNLPARTTGFARYTDGAYTSSTPFALTASTTVNLPNNKATVVENTLPDGVTTFYTSPNLLLTDADGLYNVQISFKVADVAAAGLLDISLETATDKVFSQTVNISEASTETSVVISANVVGGSTLTAKVKSDAQAYNIYNVEYTITKSF